MNYPPQIIDVFVAGLDEDPELLLRTFEEFGSAARSSLAMYALEWRDGTVQRTAE
jgi:hypothetical protein